MAGAAQWRSCGLKDHRYAPRVAVALAHISTLAKCCNRAKRRELRLYSSIKKRKIA